jgi:fructokinase
MKILSFGEIIWDVYPEEKHIGGAPFNFAAHAKRAGAEAFLMSEVGNDALGQEAVERAESYGVNCEYVSVLNNISTGVCKVALDEKGIPSYMIADSSAYDFINLSSGMGQKFDALVFGTLALRKSHNRAVVDELLRKCSFRQVFVDINVRKPFDLSESILFALERATLLKVSDEELPTVIERIGEAYLGIDESVKIIEKRFVNIEKILVTRGAEPAVLYDLKTQDKYECQSKKTKVVSTVGAGDCYGAVFLVNYLSDVPIDACMSKAAEAAAFVVSHTEAIPDC